MEDGTHSFRWSVRGSILIMHLDFHELSKDSTSVVCVFVYMLCDPLGESATMSWCKGRWPSLRSLFRATTVPWTASRVPPVFVFIKEALVRNATFQYTKLLCVTTTHDDELESSIMQISSLRPENDHGLHRS